MKHLQLILLFLFFLEIPLHAQISDFTHANFKKADSIALANSDEDLYNLPLLAHKLTSNLDTEAEQFRAIYFWVCHNISNNYNLYLRNSYKRNRFKNDSIKLKIWNNDFKKKLFKKLLKNQTTICTGYAYLVKELASLANLECEIVQGYGRVSTTDIEKLDLPNHSWNAIKLNGKWYLCDPTWASGIPNPKTNNFKFQYNDGFFLAEPKLFAINHYPIEKKWWLFEENVPSFKDFLEAPILYGKAYENLKFHNFPKQMHKDTKLFENITFEFETKETLNKKDITFLIDNGSDSKQIEPNSVTIEDYNLKIEHQFLKKGFYDVHLYIKNNLISTYTYKVKN
ncbi:hypothetical protein HNV10_00900 [Winogradskyella litoriviva]|uniref:Transglutaminase-like domain-containing protein n=1 Tax=Winogradskyella litoriviva TaxID=1220182 RepID=A0ABX2DZL9_9FLAO|nr:hypothetical protein [Winogradskyella litoriviva]NRD21778.1 hypothetical protein [Winogradskyella litoriviva]